MSKYTLLINIQSESKELLENLLVTLESINGDIDNIDSVELLALSEPGIFDANHPKVPTIYAGANLNQYFKMDGNQYANSRAIKHNSTECKIRERNLKGNQSSDIPSIIQRNLFLDKWALS